MSKFIGKKIDRNGNLVYVIGFDENEVKYSGNVNEAILITNEDKLIIKKALREHYEPNITYVKLEKFESMTSTTLHELNDYEHDFVTKSVMRWIEGKDKMSLECKAFAKSDEINNVNTFKEFGEIVSKILIEKYDLKKKELQS